MSEITIGGTIGEILDQVTAIKTPSEAREYMAAYEAENPHARENIGYLAGYCDAEIAWRIWDWFECAHPIFGTRVPTDGEAFRAGEDLAAGGTS